MYLSMIILRKTRCDFGVPYLNDNDSNILLYIDERVHILPIDKTLLLLSLKRDLYKVNCFHNLPIRVLRYKSTALSEILDYQQFQPPNNYKTVSHPYSS